MRGGIKCDTYLKALALTKLDAWCGQWEQLSVRESHHLRRLGLWAKATGLVQHDRTLLIANEVNS